MNVNRNAFLGRALAFAALLVAANVSTFAQTTFRVAGVVLNDADGQPLGRTRVSLAEVQDRRKAESIVTGADGRFEFRDVPAGKFSLEGAKRNFLVTTYQWHEGFSTAIVTGAGLDTENLVLRMIPLGMISGKVIDEAGEPVRNARMKLYMRNQQFGRDRVITHSYAQTDDQGEYEFPDLIPAEYFVSAAARPWYAAHAGWVDENGEKKRDDSVAPELDVAYPTTFYNGATESDGATPISIEKGARATADIHLSAVPAMHATMKVVRNSEGAETWPSLQKLEFDLGEPMSGEMMPGANPGEMEISGLAPGSYYVVAPNDDSYTPNKSSQVELAKDGQVIELKAPVSSATVHMKVKTARGEDLPEGVSLSLWTEKRRPITSLLPLNGKSEVTFENVPAGKFAVMVNVSMAPQYTVGRISQQGGAEVEGHFITVEDGTAVEVNATLMAGVVSIEGVVKKNGKPVSGVMVALVPKDPRTHIERFRRDQSDLDGTFMVGGILPGSYTLIAVEDAWGFAWMKDGVLEKYLPHGQQVNIGVMMDRKVVLPEAVEVQAR